MKSYYHIAVIMTLNTRKPFLLKITLYFKIIPVFIAQSRYFQNTTADLNCDSYNTTYITITKKTFQAFHYIQSAVECQKVFTMNIFFF